MPKITLLRGASGVLLALTFPLRRGGRLALVFPEELLHTSSRMQFDGISEGPSIRR